MRLLSLVIQNKKGQNVIIATSPSLHTRTCILYSNFIYQHILQTYRRRLKIQRTLTLESNINCVLSINKDYILYIFIQKNELSLAFDSVKKITQFYNSNIKMFSGSSSQVRLEIISKKFVQFMSVMEQFLYTRQIQIKQYLPLMIQPFSKKKGVDQQIFNKFNHISNQNDKKIIYDSHVQSFLIEQRQIRKKSKIIDHAKKLVFKVQDDLDILQSDPEKQYFISQYRKNRIRFAQCNRRKTQTSSSLMIPSQSQIQQTQYIVQENQQVQQSLIVVQNERIKLKMNQKLELSLQNGKIKQVLQFGQILVQGNQKQTAFLNLINHEQYWSNNKVINKRVSPVSINSAVDMITQIKFDTQANYKSKAIIDYIIRKQSFTPQKIPLLFVYTRQVSSSNIQFIFKYKLNEKWKHRLYDVDISVHLNKQFLVMDCKSVPSAYSLKNNKITWKTKEILPNSNNSKGKIILSFGSSNISPKNIIKQVRLTMRANCGLIQNLKVQCQQKWGYVAQPQRTILIQYKISPNDQSKPQEQTK